MLKTGLRREGRQGHTERGARGHWEAVARVVDTVRGARAVPAEQMSSPLSASPDSLNPRMTL